MEIIIRFLNVIIKSIEILINAFVKVLDRAIVALETVSKQIISLFLSFFRLLFYILPFILFVVIGSLKHWSLIYYIGVVVLALVIVLFVRDFLIAFKNREGVEEKSLKIEKAWRVTFIMFILNIITVAYSVFYYFFGINSEEYVRNALKLFLQNVGIIK